MLRRRRQLITILCLGAYTAAARAEIYSFTNITNNSPIDVSGQLQVEVTAVGASQVKFHFTNNVGLASSITDVYFDDGTLLGIASVSGSTGVSFAQFAAPSDLPGGNDLSPDFNTTAGFSADSNAPVSHNGVNASSEWLDVIFNLKTGKDFQSVIDALAMSPGIEGSLRIGLRIQALSDGDSDSYVNNGGVVPIPGAALLGLVGLGAVGATRRRLA
jgi:hypothetical protein